MSKRLEILKASLAKKQAAFDAKLSAHITDVKSANGQPLNDKRNGHVTMNRWEKQNNTLRNMQAEIEKTKAAIEKEEYNISHVERTNDTIPKELLDLVADGTLSQWRKYPNMFFVNGVDKFRLIWDKGGFLSHKYGGQVTDPEQRKKIVALVNPLLSKFSKKK